MTATQRRGVTGDALFQFDALPLVAHDRVPNLGGALPFLVQLMNQETLLETELSRRAMICDETVEQTAVGLFISPSTVAITVTGLLREDFGDLLREAVSLDDRRVGKLLRVQNSREWPGVLHVRKISGDA